MNGLSLMIWLTALISVTHQEEEDPCQHETLTRNLHLIANKHSSLTRLHSIATSSEGRELWVMILGESVDLRPILRPQVKLVGNINGFSGPSCLFLLQFVEELLEGYTVMNSVERRLLQTLEIHVLFNMNPDGYAKSTPGDCNDKGQNAVRLNEDFRPIFPRSEDEEMWIKEMEDDNRHPETRGVINWILQNNFIVSLSFVTGFKAIIVPFDDKLLHLGEDINVSNHVETPDADIFDRLAYSYRDAIKFQPHSWQCPSLNYTFTNGITTGAKWYSIRGSMLDFNYIYGGTFELMIGMSCCRNENNPQKIRQLFLQHRKGIIGVLREGSLGLKGQVLDAITDDVLDRVELKRVDRRAHVQPMSWFTTPQGEYWRPLPPGHHLIEVSRENYHSERVEVEIDPEGVTILQIKLHPITLPDDEEKGELTTEIIHTSSMLSSSSSIFYTTTEVVQIPSTTPKIKLNPKKNFDSAFAAMWTHLKSGAASTTRPAHSFNFLISYSISLFF